MSKTSASWSIAGGGGKVGRALMVMVAKPKVAASLGLNPHPDRVLGKDGWHESSRDGPLIERRADKLPDCDVLFITTPSTDDHEPMLSLIRQQLSKGRMVITAEKGTVADHYAELTNMPGKLGLWATVGGGTKMMEKLKLDTLDPENIRELYKITNATINFIFSEIAKGKDPDAVVVAADEKGYIEPGANGLFEIFQSEAIDVARKEVLGLKMTLPGFEKLSLADIKTKLSEDDVSKALAKPDKYRYITAIFPKRARELAERVNADRLGGFELRKGGFIVIGGFLRIDRAKALKEFQAITDARTGYYIVLGPADGSTNDGDYFAKGSGAGSDVTANAMLDNYKYLRGTA